MTPEEKDRFIAEKLGLCWHEFWTQDISELDTWGSCRFCNKKVSDCGENPDFTSEAGRVQLLKLIVKHKKYYDFCCDIGTGIFTIPVRYMEDDSGLFLSEVYRWLGGVE